MPSILGYFARAITRPSPTRAPTHPLRRFLHLPRMFDVCSVAIQTMNLHYIKSVHENKVANSDRHVAAQKHNARVTSQKLITTTRRQEEYYKIISMPSRDMSKEKLLIVGPRNSSELFMAWTYGFSWDNIHGIDLYSTHPKITAMNMEDMSHADASFDAVTMCATLGYAQNTKTALAEVVRVLKPGGRFAFSVTYDPGTPDWPEETIYNGEKIRDTLHQLGMNIYHHTSTELVNAKDRNQTSHAFGAFKEISEIDLQDRLLL